MIFNQRLLCACAVLSAAILGMGTMVSAQDTAPKSAPAQEPVDLSRDRVLYLVGYSHLDTQWRWSYPQVIREFIHNTLQDNFKLLDKYPSYIFNFTGSRRYRMMKEYYPDDYEKMKQYIAAGRWFPGGSSVDEGDANVPSLESFVRHVLYGNHYFEKEFAVSSQEFMLPDCFGFPADIPSMLAHCGIKGFSTQKLTWGSANGIPFKVGVWKGPDGQSVIAALDPGAYTGEVEEDLSENQGWLKRIENTGKISGAYADYHYYGTGDRGGAPGEDSVQWVEKSIHGKGPIRVISSKADQLFKDITPQQRAKLPRYTGELLLTQHSAGSLTSQSYMKRWNRQSELLADDAERASVAAMWLGASAYPSKRIYDAWQLVLGSQMHDMLPGTSLPKAYEYCWNDYLLAQNQFAVVTQDAAGAVAAGLNTQAKGVPLVVYNPLSFERQDAVEATVEFPGEAGLGVQVTGPDGKEVPAQVLSVKGRQVKILFVARVPSVGWAAYDVRPASAAAPSGTLKVSSNSLENERYRVTVNAAGDVASIFDKKIGKEILAAPLRISFHEEKPSAFPAWNMDWKDRQKPAIAYVDGPAKITVSENGPVRVALTIERDARGSHFVQTVRLLAGGSRVELPTKIDWQTQGVSLKADYQFQSANRVATYDSQMATVERGNNESKKYEVPQHQWFDLTSPNKSFGAAVLNDSKFGSDKPDDKTMRLTLLYTPQVVIDAYQDQATQDIGRHEMNTAIVSHGGDWRDGKIPAEAAAWNQPLLAFQTTSHDGFLGRSFSLLQVSSDQVAIEAIKKAEDSDEIIVRLLEQTGRSVNRVRIKGVSAVIAAREVNGQEKETGPAVVQNGELTADFSPYQVRAFALKLAAPATQSAVVESKPVELKYDTDAVSSDKNRAAGNFDGHGRSLPAEELPPVIAFDGVDFQMGPLKDGKKNVLTSKGQKIALPEGYQRVYVLAAAVDGDAKASFVISGRREERTVQEWTGYIGQWDNRLWEGKVPELTYKWNNPWAGLVPGYVKTSPVAWFCSHRHHATRGNEFYQYSYLFAYAFDLQPGDKSLTLPENRKVRIFAVSVARNTHDQIRPAQPLYDLLESGQSTVPAIVPKEGTFADATKISIAPPLYWRKDGLHYTVDGSEPTIVSPVYREPLQLNRSTTVKAREFDSAGKGGPVVTASFTVNDTTPPSVKEAVAIPFAPEVSLLLSEKVRKISAENPSHYQFDPPVVVTTATLDPSGTVVRLKLAKTLSDTVKNQVSVSGLKDLSPAENTLGSQKVAVRTFPAVYTLKNFIADGREQETPVAGLPVKSGDAWTLNLFLKTDTQPENHTLILGFGATDKKTTGQGRYLGKFSSGVHFWSHNANMETHNELETGVWQMFTITYDGKLMFIYKDGTPIAQQPVSLSDDEAVVRLAPLDPWKKKQRFIGEFRDVAIWPTALPPEAVQMLWEKGRPKK